MFKDVIEYEDYNGDKQSEVVYFNLSKPEIIKMEMTTSGGYGAYLQTIAKSDNKELIYTTFMDLIEKSYGVKSDDGQRFIKSPEITEKFMQSEAYSEFLYKLLTDTDYMTAFCNNIIPKIDAMNTVAPSI